LEKLALKSGGSFHRITDGSELAGAMRMVAQEIRSVHVVGFTPTERSGDDFYHRDISVKLVAPYDKGLRATALRRQYIPR